MYADTRKYTDIMLDIETLGNTSNAAVVQIGAVAFDRHNGYISVPFKINVTPHEKSSMDFSTVQWWMGQSDEARRAVFEGQFFDPDEALEALNEFIFHHTEETTGYKIWSKPSTFDIVILESLYKHCSMKQPWAHWCTRDLRTLIEAAKLERGEEGVPEVAHDAGYDAEAQAKTALKCFRKIEGGHVQVPGEG